MWREITLTDQIFKAVSQRRRTTDHGWWTLWMDYGLFSCIKQDDLVYWWKMITRNCLYEGRFFRNSETRIILSYSWKDLIDQGGLETNSTINVDSSSLQTWSLKCFDILVGLGLAFKGVTYEKRDKIKRLMTWIKEVTLKISRSNSIHSQGEQLVTDCRIKICKLMTTTN